MRVLDLGASLAIWSFLVCILIYSLKYPFEARLFPLLITVPAATAMATHIIRTIRDLARAAQEKHGMEKRKTDFRVPYALIKESCWMIGFLVLIYLFGFYVATVLFLAWYLKSKRIGLFLSIGVAGGLAIANYCFFSLLMGMQLYAGVISRFLKG